jgi:dipicolinate synthase subunit B
MEEITGHRPITTIREAEPIGPKKLLDILVVAPCTGNTLAKLAAGVTDTAVTMAVKAHLRGGRPVVIAPSTNDGLSISLKNIGELLCRKHYFFVPFGQDSPTGKPNSLVADFTQIPETIRAALESRQIQPILLGSKG